MQRVTRFRVCVVTLLALSATALPAQTEHQLPQPQLDPLGGVSGTAYSIRVYDTTPGSAEPHKPLYSLERTPDGRTEQRAVDAHIIGANAVVRTQEYDQDGLLMEESTVDHAGEVLQRTRFLYDTEGRVQQEATYVPENDLERAAVFLYSGELLSEVAIYEADGRPRWRRVYRYPNEDTVEWSVLFADGRTQQAGELVYNSMGVVAEQRSRDGSGALTERIEYIHSGEGRLRTVTTHNAADEPVEHHSYRYDAAGNLVQRVIKDAEGNPVSVTRHLYSYDEHGSWIKVNTLLLETRSSRPFQLQRRVLTREIEYALGH